MPFRSEKQRRYLWAEHPEIAKRWAHKYKNKKKLPLYVNSAENKETASEKEARAYTNLRVSGKDEMLDNSEAFAALKQQWAKYADSMTAKVQLPNNPKPTYAGQEQAEITPTPNTCDKQPSRLDGDENAAKALMGKIAAVLSQRVLKEIEERKAKQEARRAQYIAQNVNLKAYPLSAGPQIPPPMGMAPPTVPQPQQPQPQQQAQNTMAPVGGGSNPVANPINAFGALSVDGNINGNAALGVKNSPDSSKMAAAISKWAAANTPCSCGCGDTVATCKCSADCKCRKPGGSCYKAEKQAAEVRDGLAAINDYGRESFRNVDPRMIRPAAILATLGGLGTGMYLNHRLNRQLRQLKKAKRPEHRKILEHFRLKDMPLIQYPKLDNAAYVAQGAFEPGLFSKGLHVDDPVISAAIAKKPAMLEKAKKHGLVIYDDKFNTPAIMAHEAGHADIGNMPWYSPSRINQSYLRDLAGIVGLAAPALGGAAGVLTRNPVLGVGAGALTGAAINAPTLINEWQATHRANKYLDEKMMAKKEREKSKQTLGTAFNTYLAGAAVPAAIMGGLGGLAYQASKYSHAAK
jgi:hypothetical protein